MRIPALDVKQGMVVDIFGFSAVVEGNISDTTTDPDSFATLYLDAQDGSNPEKMIYSRMIVVQLPNTTLVKVHSD
jgi:hypothetical protein